MLDLVSTRRLREKKMLLPTLRRIFVLTTRATMVTPNSELGYNSKVEGGVIVSRADAAINWIRTNSMWPMPMGLACCAIELMAVGGARFDTASAVLSARNLTTVFNVFG